VKTCVVAASLLAMAESAPSKAKRRKVAENERQDLRAELMARSRTSKGSVASVLNELQRRGLLTDLELGASVYEARKLGGATALHAAADTPYGKVMQSMTLELTDGETMQWDIIHPFAFIYYLSTLCAQFAATMAASVSRAQPRPLRFVLYGDELTPGNPLRSDLGRQSFNFYYAI
jgi:hypothetical protein